MENTNEKHYLTGNTYAAREILKELDCKFDPKKRQWYNTDPEKAAEAQKHVPPIPEKHQIGDAPKSLTDELKEMGCKWNKESGWYHTEKEVAERAIQRIQESEPRHYLKGNGYAVKDQLTAMQCRWDGEQKQWYTTDISKVAEAQALIENAPKAIIDKAPEQKQEKQRASERHYIEGENTRAVKDQLKELGCKWDRDRQQWYHTDPAKAKEAQKLVDAASGPTGIGEGVAGRETPGRGGDGNTVNRVVKEVGRNL